MELDDDEMAKRLEVRKFKCPCGSNIILDAEIISRETGETIQYIVNVLTMHLL